MILKHQTDICEYESSQVLDDNVVKGTVKRLTPYTIYTENQEFIDSFSTTLVNYSPISINIVDYWNKDIIDNSIIIPVEKEQISLDIIQPFEFAESDPPVDPDYGLGFAGNTGVGGSLVDLKGNFDDSPEVGICPDEQSKRYYINSMIGVQDKLAFVNMNNFYSAVGSTIKDTAISQRIYRILKELGLTTDGLFGNTNTLFTEDRYLSNRSLNTKKGTATAVRYVGQSANDAQLQGQVPLTGKYYMTVNEDAPFEYSVESNLLGVIYERFVKPLTHPIGMINNYRTVCISDVANQTEYPLVHFDYSNLTVYVDCLCYVLGEEDTPIPPDDSEIECIPGTTPNRKIFATPDGEDLWSAFYDENGDLLPEHIGNIPEDYEETVYYEEDPAGPGLPPIRLETKIWTFENGNKLFEFTKQPTINDTSRRITIEYYTYNSTLDQYTLHSKFINQRHCGIGTIGDPIRESYVKEDLQGGCEDIIYGMFQFLAEGETTPPEQIAPSGMYEGYCSDLNDNEIPDIFDDPVVKSGGVLNKWTDLYFGKFQFLSEEESDDYQVGEWPPSGLTEGFEESYFYSYGDYDPIENPEPEEPAESPEIPEIPEEA